MSWNTTTQTRIPVQRSLRRLPVAFETAGRRAAGRISRLSRDGFFVASHTLPKPGGPVRVVIHDATYRRDIELTGSVRWNTDQLEPGRSGFGVRIDRAPEGYSDLYTRLLLS